MQCSGITKSKTQCSRIVNSGNYCWQHGNQNIQNNSNILSILNTDIFNNIGKYLDYQEIGKAKLAKFPANLTTYKYCYTLNGINVELLQQLYKSVPKLKELTINLTHDVEQVVIDSFFSILKKFRNLEALNIEIENAREIYFSFDIDWSGFSLKSLRTPFIINLKTSMFYEIPTLQYLQMLFYSKVKDNDDAIFAINPDIISLNLEEYRSPYDTTLLSNFKHLKELLISSITVEDSDVLLSNISEVKTLESLSIIGDDYNYLTPETINYFPTWVRFLYLDYIGYKPSVFAQLLLPNLEYFCTANIRSLKYALPTLFSYKKLKHLFVTEVKFSIFDDGFIQNLQKLKKQNPALTFDFNTTKYDNIVETIFNLTDLELQTDDLNHVMDITDEINDLSHIPPREEKAELIYLPQLQKIFGLANLVGEAGSRSLQTHQYTTEQWRKDNGYYTSIC